MTEIWKNKNAKNLEILLLMLPDVDDLIKDTFYFLTDPNISASRIARIFFEKKKLIFVNQNDVLSWPGRHFFSGTRHET